MGAPAKPEPDRKDLTLSWVAERLVLSIYLRTEMLKAILCAIGRGSDPEELKSARGCLRLLRDITLKRRRWLEDVDAERWLLYSMGAGLTPPSWVLASDFTVPFHGWLFEFLRDREITAELQLDTVKLCTLILLHEHGDGALHMWPTPNDRLLGVGVERRAAIDAIVRVGTKKQPMLFQHACSRVHKLAVRRRLHEQTQRFQALVEQASYDPKELWSELRRMGELMTEMTGDDGRTDGW